MTACFENMGKDKDVSRNFVFMGDSRVRDVFTAFLNVTQSLDYSVNYEGVKSFGVIRTAAPFTIE